ncbi:MAG: hypothetical protein IJO96_00425 [Oscillospiraceae bacterium]|nr:hypothetical protein [Oscillospiraceae bacterium]
MKKTVRIISVIALVLTVLSTVAILLCTTVLRDFAVHLFYGEIMNIYIPYYIHLPVILSQLATLFVVFFAFLGVNTKGKFFVIEILAVVALMGLPFVNTMITYATQGVISSMGAKFIVMAAQVNNICSFITPISTAASAVMVLCCGMSIPVKQSAVYMPEMQDMAFRKAERSKKTAGMLMTVATAVMALAMLFVLVAVVFRVKMAELVGTPADVMAYVQSGRAIPWETVIYILVTFAACIFVLVLSGSGSCAGEILFIVLIGVAMPFISHILTFVIMLLIGNYVGDGLLAARGSVQSLFAIATLPMNIAKTLAYLSCGMSISAKRILKKNVFEAVVQK